MTPEQFCYWLRGVLSRDDVSADDIKRIRDELAKTAAPAVGQPNLYRPQVLGGIAQNAAFRTAAEGPVFNGQMMAGDLSYCGQRT